MYTTIESRTREFKMGLRHSSTTAIILLLLACVLLPLAFALLDVDLPLGHQLRLKINLRFVEMNADGKNIFLLPFGTVYFFLLPIFLPLIRKPRNNPDRTPRPIVAVHLKTNAPSVNDSPPER